MDRPRSRKDVSMTESFLALASFFTIIFAWVVLPDPARAER